MCESGIAVPEGDLGDLETGEGCPLPPEIAAVLRGDVRAAERRFREREARIRRALHERQAWERAEAEREARYRHRFHG